MTGVFAERLNLKFDKNPRMISNYEIVSIFFHIFDDSLVLIGEKKSENVEANELAFAYKMILSNSRKLKKQIQARTEIQLSKLLENIKSYCSSQL